jgi:hypothetical protein
VVPKQLSYQTPETGPEQDTLLRSYATFKQFTDDYRSMTQLGWKVVALIEPDRPGFPWLPLCLLRRFLEPYRYRVVFVRKRS